MKNYKIWITTLVKQINKTPEQIMESEEALLTLKKQEEIVRHSFVHHQSLGTIFCVPNSFSEDNKSIDRFKKSI
jgi:hypothetical protein